MGWSDNKVIKIGKFGNIAWKDRIIGWNYRNIGINASIISRKKHLRGFNWNLEDNIFDVDRIANVWVSGSCRYY